MEVPYVPRRYAIKINIFLTLTIKINYLMLKINCLCTRKSNHDDKKSHYCKKINDVFGDLNYCSHKKCSLSKSSQKENKSLLIINFCFLYFNKIKLNLLYWTLQII